MRCTNGHFDPMPFVMPAEAVDFQALRESTGSSTQVISEWGALCDSADDQTACFAAYDDAPVLDPLLCSAPRCSSHVISTTLGDDVKHLTSMADKRAFLGAIDTPEDAQLLVLLHGYTPDGVVSEALHVSNPGVCIQRAPRTNPRGLGPS